MNRFHFFAPLFALGFACSDGTRDFRPAFETAAFAEDLAANKRSIEVIGLSILKPMSKEQEESFGRSSYGYEESGTTIYIHVHLPGKSILSTYDIGHKPVVLSDDTGKRLSAADKEIKGMSFFSRISKDQQSCVVPFHGTKVPAADAKLLIAKGPIRIACGSDLVMKRVEVKLPSKEHIKFGDHEMAIRHSSLPGAPDREDIVRFVSPKPLEWIKTMRFLDVEGKPIEPESQGGGVLDDGKSETFDRTYQFKRRYDSITIECTYYSVFKVYDIPLDIEFGIGMLDSKPNGTEK